MKADHTTTKINTRRLPKDHPALGGNLYRHQGIYLQTEINIRKRFPQHMEYQTDVIYVNKGFLG
jgi:hypothetical protein